MGSLFSRGRVLQGVAVVFEGDVWVEEPAPQGRQVPWKAGYFSPQTTSIVSGDCRLELKDGRTGTMTCMKAQPGMTGGTNLQFQGVGPLLGAGAAAAEEVLPAKIDLRVTRVELEQYERAAERDNLSVTAWIRDRLRKAFKAEQEG